MRSEGTRGAQACWTSLNSNRAGGADVRTVRRLLEPADPVLSWMIFAGLNLLAFVLLWFYGLAQKALASDPTHITLFIVLVYVATSLHCLWRCLAISREAERASSALRAAIAGSESARGPLAMPRRTTALVAAHVRNLITKSKLTRSMSGSSIRRFCCAFWPSD